MSLFAAAVRPVSSVFVASAGTTFTSLSVLQALSGAGLTLMIDAEAPSPVHDEDLRRVLTPLPTLPEQLATLALGDDNQAALARFVERTDPEPSQPLLEVLHGKARPIVGILTGTTTGTLRRRPLEHSGPTGAARLQHDAALREAVEQMLQRHHEGAESAQIPAPKAITLEDVLAHPENYRDKPLEIVLFDVDGTTHLGETFAEGQYSIEWLIRDILRYGPKATTGLSWWRILRAIPGMIKLRRAEKKDGHADRGEFNSVFGPLLKGLDSRLAEESIRRYYQRFGSRGVSRFMQDEFIRHRQKERLIIGVSASHEFLVGLHAQKDLNIPSDNVLGTTIEIDEETQKATGNFRWLHGEEKVKALEERLFGRLREKGINFRLVAGYSDSPSDKPMLDLVVQSGGIVYATNTSKEDFKDWVIGNHGVVAEEEDGWWNDGIRRETIFSSSQVQELTATQKTPPHRPEWINDAANATVRTLAEGAGFALASPVAIATHRALSNGGHIDWSWELVSSMPTMAVAGMIASAATAFFVAPDGPVSWQRRVALRGMIPVTAALVASGHGGPFGLTGALTTALLASAAVELTTAGERMIGLRRWKGGDERKNPIGKAVGFGLLRALQFGGFQALIHGLQRIFG